MNIFRNFLFFFGAGIILPFFIIINTLSLHRALSVSLSEKIVEGKIIDKKAYNRPGFKSDKYSIKVALSLKGNEDKIIRLDKKSWDLLNIGDTLKIRYFLDEDNRIIARVIGHEKDFLSIIISYIFETFVLVLGMILIYKVHSNLKLNYIKRKNNNYLASKTVLILVLFLTIFPMPFSFLNMISESNAYSLAGRIDGAVYCHVGYITACFFFNIIRWKTFSEIFQTS